MPKKISNEEIITALIDNGTIKAAAEVLKIKPRTIYERMKTEDFKELYNQAKSEIVKTATATIQGHLKEAIETLVEIMLDQETAPQTRANCAESIIRNGLKLTEASDLLERLEAIEAKQKEIEGQKNYEV